MTLRDELGQFDCLYWLYGLFIRGVQDLGLYRMGFKAEDWLNEDNLVWVLGCSN